MSEELATHRPLHLERLTLWWIDGGVLQTADLDPAAIPELREGRVVWAHWELASLEVPAGAQPEMDDFLDCLGEHGMELRQWVSNLTLPGGGGGFRPAPPALERGGGATLFDAVASRVRADLGSAAPELEDLRPIVQRTMLTALAHRGLLLTVRYPTTCTHREPTTAARLHDADTSCWRADELERSIAVAHRQLSGDELHSGEFLAAVTFDILREADRLRSWLVTELEELDFAQLQIRGEEADAKERRHELQRRYRWLLERVTELRVALEWGWDERDCPSDHFKGKDNVLAICGLRNRQLRDLYNLKQDVRASLDLFSTVLTQETLQLTRAEQQQTKEILELTRLEQKRSAGLQTAVTYVSAGVLVPGLVASIFDALPSIFEKQPVARAAALFGAMLLSGLLTFLWARSWANDED